MYVIRAKYSRLVGTITLTLIGILALFCAIVGSIAPKSMQMTSQQGQPMAILGWYVLLPYVFVFGYLLYWRYGDVVFGTSGIPWNRVLKGVLVMLYVVQAGVLDSYLVLLTDTLYQLFFVGADVIILFMHLTPPSRRIERWAPYAYTFVACLKLSQLLPIGDRMKSGSVFGPNGLTVALLLTIPIIQLPVQISLLDSGKTLEQAGTHQMDAVFAHTLHLMDCLDLFQFAFSTTIAQSVQNTVLMLVIISFFTANAYYLALFVRRHPTEVVLVPGGGTSGGSAFPPVMSQFAFFAPVSSAMFLPSEGDPPTGATTALLAGGAAASPAQQVSSYDEDMLHYLIWLCFYIDLPMMSCRLVLWGFHNVSLSMFLAKNVKMIVVVLTMMVKHSKIVTLMTHGVGN